MEYSIKKPVIENVLLLTGNFKSVSGKLCLTPNFVVFNCKNYEIWEQTTNIYKCEKISNTITSMNKNSLMISMYLKNFKQYKFSFANEEDLNDFCIAVRYFSYPPNGNHLYAFTYFEQHKELYDNPLDNTFYDPEKEYARMGALDNGFVISKVNEKYEISPFYASRLCLPDTDISHDPLLMKRTAKFRNNARFPLLSYYYKKTNASIAICAQPLCGVYKNTRSIYDEYMVALVCLPGDKILHKRLEAAMDETIETALNEQSSGTNSPQIPPKSNNDASFSFSLSSLSANNSTAGSPAGSRSNLSPVANKQAKQYKYSIYDVRSQKLAAKALSAGGGSENSLTNLTLNYVVKENQIGPYEDSSFTFLNCPSSTSLRDNYDKLRSLILEYDISLTSFLYKLESSEWMSCIHTIFKSVKIIVNTVHVEGKSCLIHGENGWDWSLIINSISQIMLDPYYRTILGFICLIEKNWLSAGHRFSDRNAQFGKNVNYEAPFMQLFLDCINQLVNLYPNKFEFNDSLLAKLSVHIYSSPFGTFYFNCERERKDKHEKIGKTCSFWKYIMTKVQKSKITNQRYVEYDDVLSCPSNPHSFGFWQEVYTKWFHLPDRIALPKPSDTPWNTTTQQERIKARLRKRYDFLKNYDEIDLSTKQKHGEEERRRLENEEELRNSIIEQIRPDFPDIYVQLEQARKSVLKENVRQSMGGIKEFKKNISNVSNDIRIFEDIEEDEGALIPESTTVLDEDHVYAVAFNDDDPDDHGEDVGVD